MSSTNNSPADATANSKMETGSSLIDDTDKNTPKATAWSQFDNATKMIYEIFLEFMTEVASSNSDNATCYRARKVGLEISRLVEILQNPDSGLSDVFEADTMLTGMCNFIACFNSEKSPKYFNAVFTNLHKHFFTDPNSHFYEKKGQKRVNEDGFVTPGKTARPQILIPPVEFPKLPSENPFENLEHEEPPVEMQEPTNENSTSSGHPPKNPEHSNSNENKKKTKHSATPLAAVKPQPFFVAMDQGWRQKIKDINTELGITLDMKMSGQHMKLFPKTVEQYRAIQTCLQKRSMKYFSLDLKINRPKKILLRGLPRDIPLADVKTDLSEQGHDVDRVAQIRQWNENTQTREGVPLFIAYIRTHENSPDPYKDIKKVVGIYVRVETYRTKGPRNCYNCQGFNHNSVNCFFDVKCIICAEGHRTDSCTKDPKTEAKCANCGGPHTSIDRTCPKNPTNIQAARQEAKTLSDLAKQKKTVSKQTRIIPSAMAEIQEIEKEKQKSFSSAVFGNRKGQSEMSKPHPPTKSKTAFVEPEEARRYCTVDHVNNTIINPTPVNNNNKSKTPGRSMEQQIKNLERIYKLTELIKNNCKEMGITAQEL